MQCSPPKRIKPATHKGTIYGVELRKQETAVYINIPHTIAFIITNPSGRASLVATKGMAAECGKINNKHAPIRLPNKIVTIFFISAAVICINPIAPVYNLKFILRIVRSPIEKRKAPTIPPT